MTDKLDPGSRGSSKKKGDSSEEKGLIGFFKTTRQELDKVSWPDRKQLIGESVAVLLIVVAMASFIFLIDQAFSWIATQVFA